MAVLKLNLEKKPYVPPIRLPERYQPDKWYIKEWELYKTATESWKTYWKRYGHADTECVDFSLCENLVLKNELKYFLSSCVEEKKVNLHTFTGHEGRMRHIINFANKYYPDSISILDIPHSEFIDYLLENKIIENTRMQDGKKLKANMEYVPQERKHRTVALFTHIQRVVTEYNERNTPEFKKDKWFTRNIAFVEEPSGSYKNLDFRNVEQIFIREQLKRYFYFKLKAQVSTGTAYNNLESIKVFIKWLYKNHPKETDFKNLTRDMLEEYFLWLRTKSGFSNIKLNRCVLVLKNYLEEGYQLGLEYFPDKPLILPTDYKFKKKPVADFYSDTEISRINELLLKMDPFYGKIVLFLEMLALRISDLITLTPDMISEITDEDGSAGLHKFQIKTNKAVSIYLTPDIHGLLMDQYNHSKELYGEDVKYIFATGKDTHISGSAIRGTVNKYFKENELRGDNGELLHFIPKKLRATKATKLLSTGFSSMEASKTLGHSNLQSLSYYANVTLDTVIDSLSPFIQKAQLLIENIGKTEFIDTSEFEKALPLCNGWCCRPIGLGICEHANYCLSCDLFRPDSRHLNYYSMQLEELKATLNVAKVNNNEPLVKKTLKDIENVERIINKVNELCRKTQKD